MSLWTIDDFTRFLKDVAYPAYTFTVALDGRGALFLQGTYVEADIGTGVPETQVTRRWFVSPYMTKSEFVQTVLKCVLTSMEHRVREHFLYKGYRVYGPHYDVEALAELCRARALDVRPTQPVAGTEAP